MEKECARFGQNSSRELQNFRITQMKLYNVQHNMLHTRQLSKSDNCLVKLNKYKHPASVRRAVSVNELASLVRDIGEPKGLASVICMEQFGIDDLSQRTEQAESLQSCLFGSTEEEPGAAEAVWKRVLSHDEGNLFKDRTDLRRRVRKRARYYHFISSRQFFQRFLSFLNEYT